MMAVSGALRAAVLALTVIAIGVSQPAPAASQGIRHTTGTFEDKFRQLDEVLPDANVYRTAGG